MSLNEPCALRDTTWIKPGKAAWHWWNGTVAKGAGFQSGMNKATLQHYVDFASEHGLEYVQIDEGWYVNRKGQIDITRSIPEVDVENLVRYGSERRVGLFLWLDWQHLESQIEAAFLLYQRWGIAGVKVDFMDRDDQLMVNFCQKVVEQAAEHRLLVNFHGAFKPDGSQRTWPNLITREAVLGLEWSRTSRRCNPEHEVTLPFTRMLAGPMDFTPGAFRNAAREQFVPRQTEPMAQGTRARQLAMYVIYESPLQMLVDYPEAYRGETGIEFLQRVPTVWDETRVLQGEVGEHILVARRSGSQWFVGSMTDWNPRTVTFALQFLSAGQHLAEIYSDAGNPNSVKFETRFVSKATLLTARLASGGGLAIRIRPAKLARTP